MSRITTFLICGLLLVSPAMKAQQTVTGRITDAMNGKPLSQATIFVAGTTIGTASDESGNYSIIIPGEGIYEIVFYHAGYQPKMFKILNPMTFHQLDEVMVAGTNQETVIMPHSQKDVDINWYGQKDVDFFWYKESMRYRKIFIPELKDILLVDQEHGGIRVNISSPLYWHVSLNLLPLK